MNFFDFASGFVSGALDFLSSCFTAVIGHTPLLFLLIPVAIGVVIALVKSFSS